MKQILAGLLTLGMACATSGQGNYKKGEYFCGIVQATPGFIVSTENKYRLDVTVSFKDAPHSIKFHPSYLEKKIQLTFKQEELPILPKIGRGDIICFNVPKDYVKGDFPGYYFSTNGVPAKLSEIYPVDNLNNPDN